MEIIVSMLAHWAAGLLEVVGIGIIVLGALVASGMFVYGAVRSGAGEKAFRAYRRNLGRAILLGLEFLVGADIIATVAIEPTFASVGVLALIVLVRTFLSFSLGVEIDGHWPWQARTHGAADGNS